MPSTTPPAGASAIFPSGWSTFCRRNRDRAHRPPRRQRRVADRVEVDLRHRHAEALQDAVGQFVVAVEAAAQPAAPGEFAAVGGQLEEVLAMIERRSDMIPYHLQQG